ncbi:hypothetical protein ACPVPU_10635 [Sphingomonas sp. CJ99]
MAVAAILLVPPAYSQTALSMAEMGQAPSPYPEIADLSLRSTVVVDATIRSLARITGPEAAMVPPGWHRYYVTADVGALIRGSGTVPPRIGYVLDVPLDARGKPPKLKKSRVLLFGRPVATRPDQLQLVGLNAQQPWSPRVDEIARSVIREILDPAAPPEIVRISNIFHVPGSLPGEGETQIFLATSTGEPVSLLVQRRPGTERRWAVALGDIVDQAAGPPQPETLLYYRLSCGLPPMPPAGSLATETAEAERAAKEDYALIRSELGPCGAKR